MLLIVFVLTCAGAVSKGLKQYEDDGSCSLGIFFKVKKITLDCLGEVSMHVDWRLERCSTSTSKFTTAYAATACFRVHSTCAESALLRRTSHGFLHKLQMSEPLIPEK